MTAAVDMRGFSCAVSAPDVERHLQPAGIAVGIDGEGDDRRYAIALRHADGTTLVAYLSDHLLDRLTNKLAELVSGEESRDAPIAALRMVH